MSAFKEVYKIAEEGELYKIAAFLFFISVSVGVSLLVSYIYVRFSRNKYVGDMNIYKLFPLLALAMTSIFTALQFSIPLSLGLLGSLSVVRFRTPIKDPLEIGFILIVIAVSLLSATANLNLLVGVLIILLLVLFLLEKDALGVLNIAARVGMIIARYPLASYKENESTILSGFKFYGKQGRIEYINEVDGYCVVGFLFKNLQPEQVKDIKSKVDFNANFNVYFNVNGDDIK